MPYVLTKYPPHNRHMKGELLAVLKINLPMIWREVEEAGREYVAESAVRVASGIQPISAAIQMMCYYA